MAYKAPVKSDEINRTEHLCKHCGSWVSKWGYMDDKHRTTKKVYCSYCDSAAKRKESDRENAQILKERNGK